MSDLKTPYFNPVISSHEAAGDDIPASGGDPNVDLGGASGLKPLWEAPVAPTPNGRETANSVSGLPLLPSRMAPSATPPPPPDLTDRTPGLIDK